MALCEHIITGQARIDYVCAGRLPALSHPLVHISLCVWRRSWHCVRTSSLDMCGLCECICWLPRTHTNPHVHPCKCVGPMRGRGMCPLAPPTPRIHRPVRSCCTPTWAASRCGPSPRGPETSPWTRCFCRRVVSMAVWGGCGSCGGCRRVFSRGLPGWRALSINPPTKPSPISPPSRMHHNAHLPPVHVHA